MQELYGLISTMSFADAIDIAIVALLFFFIFSLLKGSRSQIALRGLITLLLLSFFIYFISRVAGLVAVEMIFSNIWIIIVLVFVMVFQSEFRKALTDLGQLRVFRALFTQSGQYVNELIGAVRVMSKRHVGALIAIERRNPLRVYSETGTPIDATISTELLRTIFTPYSALHDGAVMISGDRIVSAHCILPLAEAEHVSKDLGTRHRAALGLSEETDALVIVVSEETGTISLAVGGHLERPLTPEDLRKRLEIELNLKETDDKEDEGESTS
jgi:diadenylate cyclase